MSALMIGDLEDTTRGLASTSGQIPDGRYRTSCPTSRSAAAVANQFFDFDRA